MDQSVFRSILRKQPKRLEGCRVWTYLAGNLGLWLVILGLARGGNEGKLWRDLAVGILFAGLSFRSFSYMHECVHSAGSKSPRWNNFLGFVSGVFCFLPFAGWRDMHLDHHRWTGNIDRDPATAILLAFEKAHFKTPKVMSWSWRLWLPLLGFMQHVVFWKATVSKREFLFIFCSVGYLGGADYVLGPTALLCGLISYLFLVECINLPHHLGMRQYHGEQRFALFEQNRFTRSCVYPKWFAHHVLLNFNLHTAHHLFPSHPWYQLDALHEKLVEHGMQLNMCNGNSWVIEARKKDLDSVLNQTFAPAEENDRHAA